MTTETNENEWMRVHRLLEQFMDGETTLDEERYLGEWLRSHEVDETLRPYKQMFAYFDSGMTSTKAPSSPRRALRRMWWKPAVAAASLAVLVGLGITMTNLLPVDDEPLASSTTASVDTIALVDTLPTPQPAPLTQAAAPASRQHRAEQRRGQQAARPLADSRESRLVKKSDSIEVLHTEASLELANSEYIAEQIDLQQQLSQLRMQSQLRAGQRQVSVSLPCQ